MIALQRLLVFAALLSTALGELAMTFDEMKNEILEEHNKLRKIYQAGPLKLDEELCKGAQQEAQRYVESYIQTGNFSRNPVESEDRNYNDNVLGHHSWAKKKWTGKKVVADWIKQKDVHNWTENYFDHKSGHFTQMIWSSSEEIGVGMASGRGKIPRQEYIDAFVVRYSPPGNILDRETFSDNVLPAKQPDS